MNPQGDGDGPNREKLLYASQKSIFCPSRRGRTISKRFTNASSFASTLGVIALGAPFVPTVDAQGDFSTFDPELLSVASDS